MVPCNQTRRAYRFSFVIVRAGALLRTVRRETNPRGDLKMRNRTKFIVTILALMIVAVMVFTPSPQSSRAIALSNPPATEPMFGGVSPGPSQFYEQHNLVSDGFVPADLLDSNL